ncbi:MAG: NAD(P)-binding domain-containing protein, partial [Burkholderiales bacterium]|nr:NAD(P)-binding domain-containing protein [Burkholderiales bacterium]
MNAIRKIGFIGVGNMGNPMAGHLAKAGFDVTVFDTRPETMETFVAQHGSSKADSAAAAAHGADALITMLPNDKIVRRVVLDEGAAAALATDGIVIDMSTSGPTATRALAEALEPSGIVVVDAPV